MLFHVIEGSAIVLRSRGVYKQVAGYQRGGWVYAAAAGGYIKLLPDSLTSHPNWLWDHFETADDVEWSVVPGKGIRI